MTSSYQPAHRSTCPSLATGYSTAVSLGRAKRQSELPRLRIVPILAVRVGGVEMDFCKASLQQGKLCLWQLNSKQNRMVPAAASLILAPAIWASRDRTTRTKRISSRGRWHDYASACFITIMQSTSCTHAGRWNLSSVLSSSSTALVVAARHRAVAVERQSTSRAAGGVGPGVGTEIAKVVEAAAAAAAAALI